MKKISTLLSIISFFTLTLSGCNPQTTSNDQVKPDDTNKILEIVTTIPPIYSYTSYLTSDTDVNITNIVPPNTSVHTFALTPAVRKSLANADLIIINGQELEYFLEDVLIEYKDKVIDTSSNIDLIAFEEDSHEDEYHGEESEEHHDEDHEDEEHSEGDDHDENDKHEEHHHGAFDPHIWLNPNNALLQAKTIYQALINLQPKNQALYNQNLKNFEKEIQILDASIKADLRAVNIKPYIVFHNAYGYLEEAYGIKANASFEEFPGKEPSATYLKELIQTIQKENIEIIFTEPQFSPKLVTTISQDYDLKVATLDPLGSELSSDGYFNLMKKNIESIKSAFTK